MADLIQFNQNSNDSPLIFSRAFGNKNMNLDAVNLKKRKLLPGVAEDLGLPAPKHKCCETVADSEYDLSPTSSMVTEDVHTWVDDSEPDINSMLDTQGDSTQDSSSGLGDTKSGILDVNVNAGFGNSDSYYEASTSWAGSSRNKRDGKEEEKCINQDTSWLDADDLEVCISSEYCHDNSGQTTKGGLHEFLSSSGVDPSLFALASESWGGEQETHPGRPKPTIDQEFEQYFSSLML
ncbi:uncharacterized protein LOC141611052 [Silene latifolia]|uniref:uncharacterized protein LOC141611052 n=1 Tax=Silene latifolia TaxID=37657 RepID=UPI003D78878A